MMAFVLVALAVLLALTDLLVSLAVCRCTFYTQEQKTVQLVLVWLVPVIGVIVVGAFLRAQYNLEKFDTRCFPEPAEKMVAAEMANERQNAAHPHQ